MLSLLQTARSVTKMSDRGGTSFLESIRPRQTLADSYILRLITFSGLYLVQGIPTGFITITLAALVADHGYSAAVVAQLMVLNYIPWAAKVLYGPIIDGHEGSAMGQQRPWLLMAHAAMAFCLIILLVLPGVESGIAIIGGIIFVYNVFGALHDVATDALSVEHLHSNERGFVSGAMWSSKMGGIAIGGAGMSTVLAQYGWRSAIGIQLFLVLASVLLPLLIREHPDDRCLSWPPLRIDAGNHHLSGYRRSIKRVTGQVLTTFQQPRVAILAMLTLVAAVPTRMMVTFGPIFTVQTLGWSDTAYSQFAGGPALLAGAGGAIIGGWVADKMGRKKMIGIAITGIITSFLICAAGQPFWSESWFIVAFFLIGMFLDMAMRMALQAICMNITREAIVATQFTIYMTLGNMSNVIGSALLTPLTSLCTPEMIFLSAALIGVIPLILLRRFAQTSTGLTMNDRSSS